MKLLLTIVSAATLFAGSAIAQDATTRGGAESSMPSTRQNSPNTGPSTTNPGQTQRGPATINNAPVGSNAQKADQERQAPRTGDTTKTAPITR